MSSDTNRGPKQKRGFTHLSDQEFIRRLYYATEHRCPRIFQNLMSIDDSQLAAQKGLPALQFVQVLFTACFAREMDESKLDECLPPTPAFDNIDLYDQRKPRELEIVSDVLNSVTSCLNTERRVKRIEAMSKRADRLITQPLRETFADWGTGETVGSISDSQLTKRKFRNIEDRAKKQCQPFLAGDYPSKILYNQCITKNICGWDLDEERCFERTDKLK